VTRVVHCKQEQYDVYIGRPGKWGNPLSHLEGKGDIKVDTREEAIQGYELYLESRPDLVADIKRELKDKVLGCWCKPKDCHGDILARIADE
jgi:hypothetical protein